MVTVVIVGGGIVGVAIADALAERGHAVMLLERGRLGDGTTGKSIGCFVEYLAAVDAFRPLIERSWAMYGPAIEADEIEYHREGALKLASSTEYYEHLRSGVDALAELGIEAAPLESTDVEAYGVAADAAPAGAVSYLGVGRLDAGELVAWFAHRARANGAEILTDTAVTSIDTSEGSLDAVRTAGGDVPCDVLVNAAGPWAPTINAMVGVDLPLGHTRAPILALDVSERLELSLLVCEDGLYFTGERSTAVLAGHSPHEAAAAATGQPVEAVADPDRIDRFGRGAAGESFRDKVAIEAERIVPALADAAIVNEWCGLRCVTPDELPVVGPVGPDGFHVATGMSGIGITIAPAVAEAVAESIDRGMPARSSLDPGRFA